MSAMLAVACIGAGLAMCAFLEPLYARFRDHFEAKARRLDAEFEAEMRDYAARLGE